MGLWTQPFYDRGMAEGEARGEARGEVRGEAKMLTRFLEKRFGVVPPLLRERIFAASVEKIEAWGDRVVDAPDLHSIFDTNWLGQSTVAINSEAMHETLLRLVSTERRETMGLWTQPFYDKGFAKGMAKVLTRTLENRFGVMSPLLRERISAANVEQIEDWFDRAFDAPDIDSVFESN